MEKRRGTGRARVFYDASDTGPIEETNRRGGCGGRYGDGTYRQPSPPTVYGTYRTVRGGTRQPRLDWLHHRPLPIQHTCTARLEKHFTYNVTAQLTVDVHQLLHLTQDHHTTATSFSPSLLQQKAVRSGQPVQRGSRSYVFHLFLGCRVPSRTVRYVPYTVGGDG